MQEQTSSSVSQHASLQESFSAALRDADALAPVGCYMRPADAWSRAFGMDQSEEVTGLSRAVLQPAFDRISAAFAALCESSERTGLGLL